jgi:hypothetical protein
VGGDVDLRISVLAAERAVELESLHDWLRGEPALGGLVARAAPRPREGELGTLTDALIVAVGEGGVLSVLAVSLNTWMSRPRRSDIRIKIEGAHGRVVEISAERLKSEDVEALVRKALGSGAPEE